jgi:hypothetical protein
VLLPFLTWWIFFQVSHPLFLSYQHLYLSFVHAVLISFSDHHDMFSLLTNFFGFASTQTPSSVTNAFLFGDVSFFYTMPF